MTTGAGCDAPASCGCCDGIHVVTPVAVYNRPGLDALAYRVGTHGRFLATMLARLSGQDHPALARLRTRDRSDPSVALLDGWATIADVLAFYQERIANEGFLRTATERRSVVELARLIGYTPRPGLSASVFLAYSVEAGHRVLIPAGTKAQSVPADKELPRTFETAEPITATGELTALSVVRTRPQVVLPTQAGSLRQLVLAGAAVAAHLRPGDVLRATGLAGPATVVLLNATAVASDAVSDTTTVAVALHQHTTVPAPPTPPGPVPFAELKARFGQPADFGVPAAAAAEALALIAQLGHSKEHTDTGIVELVRDLYSRASTAGGSPLAAWLAMVVEASDAAIAALQPPKGSSVSVTGTGETRVGRLVDALRRPPSIPPATAAYLRRDVTAVYSTQSGAVTSLLEVVVPSVKGVLASALANTAELPPLPVAFDRMAVNAGLFGHQAHFFPIFDGGSLQGYIDPLGVSRDVISDGPISPVPPQFQHVPIYTPGRELLLDAVHNGITAGASIVLVNPLLTPPVVARAVTAADQVSVTAFGVSGRVTKLTLDADWPQTPDESIAKVLRNTQVLAQPVAVPLARVSIDDTPLADDVIELAGLHPDLAPGRFVTVSGERVDADLRALQGTPSSAPTGVPGVELAMVASVEHRAALLPGGTAVPGDTAHTFLRLAQPLAYAYRRPTVVVNANVVKATHGVRAAEVLGAGDATRAFQAFTLKQPPVTYLPVPTAAGARSVLEVRVNDVEWHEAEDLLGAGPDDRRFVLRTDDDGQSTVIFGDGDRGARLPTGMENVRAAYRTGLGKGGNVGAGRIQVAVDRPLGVKDVVNPLAATGGADAETRDQARRNAPVAIQALDRLVSVQDYADFARAFAGIGSAAAMELSDGRRELVHVTIAGVDDAPIASSSDLYANLLRALVELGDPFEPVELAVREVRVVVLQAGVRVEPDYRWMSVEPVLRAALVERFGAERRQLGEDVVQADVLATMQAVPGVAFVQLRVLDSVGEPELRMANPASGLRLLPRVAARLARRGAPLLGRPSPIKPAQLVIVTPAVPDTVLLSELP